MNYGIRFFFNVKCTGNYNIYLTKLPSAFPVSGTQLLFSSVWQECCCPENHHFPSLVFDWRQTSMLGFLRYSVQLILRDVTLKMIVAICFSSAVKPHAFSRNSGHVCRDVFCVPFIIVKRWPTLKFKTTENTKKKTSIISDLSRNEGKWFLLPLPSIIEIRIYGLKSLMILKLKAYYW